MSRTLTLQTLIDEHACLSQAELFSNTFGDSVEVTPELCLSVADKFDWDWAARHLLSSVARADYVRATEACADDYDRVTAPAWADYVRATASAQADYNRATAPAWADYGRVMASAPASYTARTWADYNRARKNYYRVTASAQADYDRATATAQADYVRAKATAWADYVRATAFAFGKCYAESSQPC